MNGPARLITEFEERNIRIILDGERLVVDGPADAVTDDLLAELRTRKQEIIQALCGWRVTYVTVDVAHGRLWLSTVERAYGIPLAPGECITLPPLGPPSRGCLNRKPSPIERRVNSGNRGTE
jgi:hypothetical protein